MSLKDMMEKYKGNGGGGYFSLKDDNDTAVVRFLYDTVGGDSMEGKDIDAYVVHQVEIDGKKKYIKCLETGDCPLCKANNKAQLKIFLQLYDYTDDKVKVWERGQKFIGFILGYINKYGSLVERQYDVERHGKKGSTDTTYMMYSRDKDDGKLADFEKSELLGKLILVKTKAEMQAMINGEAPNVTPRQQGTTDVF